MISQANRNEPKLTNNSRVSFSQTSLILNLPGFAWSSKVMEFEIYIPGLEMSWKFEKNCLDHGKVVEFLCFPKIIFS